MTALNREQYRAFACGEPYDDSAPMRSRFGFTSTVQLPKSGALVALDERGRPQALNVGGVWLRAELLDAYALAMARIAKLPDYRGAIAEFRERERAMVAPPDMTTNAPEGAEGK